MNKRIAIGCDIDGTILDISARYHLLDGVNTNWEEFLNEDNIRTDKPITQVCTIIRTLAQSYPIVFITGRNEGTRAVTVEQLEQHISPDFEYELIMRPDGMHIKDTEMKSKLYHEQVADRYELLCMFEDKQCVTDMWRSLGIKVFQVEPPSQPDGF